jgi:hypothetical protein
MGHAEIVEKLLHTPAGQLLKALKKVGGALCMKLPLKTMPQYARYYWKQEQDWIM